MLATAIVALTIWWFANPTDARHVYVSNWGQERLEIVESQAELQALLGWKADGYQIDFDREKLIVPTAASVGYAPRAGGSLVLVFEHYGISCWYFGNQTKAYIVPKHTRVLPQHWMWFDFKCLALGCILIWLLRQNRRFRARIETAINAVRNWQPSAHPGLMELPPPLSPRPAG